mmetsp:Transcript_2810/g.6168  ORF Transcript_2810/g.6168 Transcript_2810/m.6168 type:complete len:107 (+) Transcript_2810:36-356(+)
MHPPHAAAADRLLRLADHRCYQPDPAPHLQLTAACCGLVQPAEPSNRGRPRGEKPPGVLALNPDQHRPPAALNPHQPPCCPNHALPASPAVSCPLFESWCTVPEGK